MDNAESDSTEYYSHEQDAMLDQVVEQAVDAAARGENIEQMLEIMLSMVQGKQKDTIKRKFSAALKKRGLRQPTGDSVYVPSQNALTRIRNALAISARQAFDRVLALVKARPDIADRIHKAGEILARNGVVIEKIQMSEAELGGISPTPIGKAQTQTTEVGR